MEIEEVHVVAYNDAWKAGYEEERRIIENALSDILIDFQHIGSTSVPGLGAKPTIDMMAGIQDLSDLTPEHIRALHEIQYEYIEKPDFPERRFFRKGRWRAGTHHLHIYTYHGFHWNSNLLFRNYLIHHPDVKHEYLLLKKKLEAEFKNDRAGYTAAKAPFIESIICRAWAELN